MNHMTKALRIILSVILFFGMLFFLLKVLGFCTVGSANLQIFTKAQALYGNEKCFVDDDNIYVVNEQTGTIHIFDNQGMFVKGIQLPTQGGIVWTAMTDKLNVYCVRGNILFEISDTENVEKREIFYSNPDEFHDSFETVNGTEAKIDKNVVSVKRDNSDTKISLDVKTTILSLNFCLMMCVLCFIAFLFISGSFKIILNFKNKF